MAEIWKIIPNFPMYSASSSGRIKRHDTTNPSKPPRVLKLGLNNYGYQTVGVYRDKKHYAQLVHSLVAEAFLGQRPDGLQVNHKNAVKSDNRIENLEYVTAKENTRHAHELGLRDKCYGFGENYSFDRGGIRKITANQVASLKAKIRDGESSIQKLADEFNVSYQIVKRIKAGRTWAKVLPDST